MALKTNLELIRDVMRTSDEAAVENRTELLKHQAEMNCLHNLGQQVCPKLNSLCRNCHADFLSILSSFRDFQAFWTGFKPLEIIKAKSEQACRTSFSDWVSLSRRSISHSAPRWDQLSAQRSQRDCYIFVKWEAANGQDNFSESINGKLQSINIIYTHLKNQCE